MFKSSKSKKGLKNIVSFLLVAAILITGALAYLTATDSKTNTFTVGNVKIELTEPLWDTNNPDGTLENIVAGQKITKDPTITNTGANDAYVYVMVEIPKVYNTEIAAEDGTKTTETHYPLFTFEANDGWTLVNSQVGTEDDAYDYYLYAYNTALAPNDSAKLFDEVTFANITDTFVNTITGEDIVDLQINVTGYAIQSNYYDEEATNATEAWELYVNQNDWSWPDKGYEGISTLNFLNEAGTVVNTTSGYTGAPVDMYFDSSLAKDGFTFDWVDSTTNEVAYSGMPMPEGETDLVANYTETGYGTEPTTGLPFVIYYSDELGLYAQLSNAAGMVDSEGNPLFDYSQYNNTTVIIPSTITIKKDLYEYDGYEAVGFYDKGIHGSATDAMAELLSNLSENETATLPVKSLGRLSLAKLDPANVVIPDSVCDFELRFCSPGSGETNTTQYITKVILPYGSDTIGRSAFSNCTTITEVTLPASLKTIEERVFENCTALTTVNNLKYVETIGDYAFYGATALTSADLSSAKTIGVSAFHKTGTELSALTNITLGNNIEALGENCFSRTAITEITLPASMKDISNALAACSNLVTINYKGTVEDWCRVAIDSLPTSAVVYIDGAPISGDIIIPDDVTNISKYAFRGCSGITSVTIPDSVTSIGDYAFNDCTGLTVIKIPNSVTTIGTRAFYGCSNLKTIYIGKGVTEIKGFAFNVTPDDVYYAGTEEEYAAITFGSANRLANATKHYNYSF